MEWNEILEKLFRVRKQFLEQDGYLLSVDANERSMTHKFAEYLQREFETWNVDCEYNRDGDIPKRLLPMLADKVSPADEHARTVFPDIIVHRRGRQGTSEEGNLLVIEAKKSGNDDSADVSKLEAFKLVPYGYSFAVRLVFVTGASPEIEVHPLP